MKKIIIASISCIPSILLAAGLADGFSDFSSFFAWSKLVLIEVSKLLLAAAVVFFLWNVFIFVKSGGDEAGKTEARDKMIYGIIGIAVMVSVWGLVSFVVDSTVGTSPNIPFNPPGLPRLP